MSYNLYLDDERNPKTNRNWIIVRSYAEGVAYVKEYGMPSYVSLDHDLGTEESGYDFTKWLVEQDICKNHLFPENFEYNVHSANGPGANNIRGYMNSYMDYRTHGTRPPINT